MCSDILHSYPVRDRWRPSSQAYYSTVIRAGNSLSEEYPKKCYDDYKPPQQAFREYSNNPSLISAGLPAGQADRQRAHRHVQNLSNIQKTAHSTILEPATGGGNLADVFGAETLKRCLGRRCTYNRRVHGKPIANTNTTFHANAHMFRGKKNYFPASMISGFSMGGRNHAWIRYFSSTHMSHHDCFATLGIPIGSGADAIKNAYRKLAKIHHPDLGGSSERFVRIQKAYVNLMEAGDAQRPSADRSTSSTSSSSSSYWRAWDSDGSWWNTTNSSKYTSEDDFEAEFEAQWKKFNSQKRSERQSRRRYRAREDSDKEEDPEYEGANQDDAYSRYKTEFGGKGRGRKKSQKRTPSPAPPHITVTVDTGRKNGNLIEPLAGDYDQVSKFNGKLCYMNKLKNLFVFWSNKNQDWKISDKLKDDGNCIAFNDSITASHPWTTSANSSKWMVWSDRGRRYLSVPIMHECKPIDFSTWSVTRLRSTLEQLGLEKQIESMFEKSQLVELMELYYITGKKKRGVHKKNESSVPENHFQICSRQRHDGVVQSPPVLSERCTVAKNRIESFVGTLDELDEWIYENGDRRRFYGVYDYENNYCFGLIWKDNKHWGRAGKHDY